MEYSIERIMKFVDNRVRKLMNDEYTVEGLPNHEDLYSGKIEEIYSEAIRNTNPQSRLFTATYED